MGIIAWTKLTAAWVLTNAAVIKSQQRQWGLESEAAADAGLTRTPLMNGAIVASVAGNVLTVAIKRLDGSDPASGVNSVYADFRHATQGNGQSNRLAITAALSAIMSGGSTGGFVNGVPGRLWVGIANDAGTPRLAFYNAYGGSGALNPLLPSMLASSTAEGGIGGATSAGVWYSTVAFTSKPILILGYLSWETPLATAGLWTAVPDVVHQQRWGDRLAGDLVQRQVLVDGAMATTTTTESLADTIPVNTAGGQFASLAITPASKANILEITHDGNYACSVAAEIIAALFQDSTANALVATGTKVNNAGDLVSLFLSWFMVAATVSATTFKVRAGPSTAGTVTYNGAAGARLFGGVFYSRFVINERMG